MTVNVVTLGGCDPVRSNTRVVEVNGREATTLLDSGCGIDVFIDASIVKDKNYTGEFVQVKFTIGNEDVLSVALVDVKSDYVSGSLKAALLRNSTFDLIWGCKFIAPCKNPVLTKLDGYPMAVDTNVEVMPMTYIHSQ